MEQKPSKLNIPSKEEIKEIAEKTEGQIIGTAIKNLEVRGAPLIGVAAAYSTEAGAVGTDVWINIYDDLDNTIFIAQADGVDIAGTTQTLLQYDATVTAASTCDGNETSIHEIAHGTTGLHSAIYVIDKVDRVDNAWGGWVDCYCKIVSDVAKQKPGAST